MHDIIQPNTIRTHEREVSLLFADLRGFTELAASLEAIPLACELAGHVMDCLTDAVTRHGGHVVDYFGDGLLAMWNAPVEQPEHAQLACGAALAMLDRLPCVAGDWAPVLQTELRLGAGVHTGLVQVGNAGSSKQAKYGPRGPSVHTASRVEAATKSIGLDLIATAATAGRLSDDFATNRVCRARMPGLNEPIDLYAVRRAAAAAHVSMAWRLYDTVLRHFEEGRLQEASDMLPTINGIDSGIPWSFLATEVRRELGSQQRRRSTDKPADCPAGVIMLNVKQP